MNPATEAKDNYKWWVLIIVMIGTMMAALDSSIVNVSLPAIMADFGAGVDDIEWVITGYMLAFATLMPLTAWLRDRIGHKFLFVVSLIVFVGGSVLCGLAWNLPSLIVARVIQALGGGAITPTAMAMISEVFPPEERGKAIGLWGVGVIVGPAFGPTLGGYLTNAFGWRSIFLVNLPVGIIGILLALEVLRADRPHPHAKQKPFEYWSFTFLTIFLISFLLGLSQGEKEGWGSAYIITCFAASFFSFVLWLTSSLQVEHPVVELSLLESPVFAICVLLTAVRSVVLFGGTFLLPVFCQQLMGLDEIQTGLLLLPGALIIGVFMPISGALSDKMGPRLLTVAGTFCLGLFMYMYKDISISMSKWDIIWPTLIRGFGLGLLMAPVSATAMNAVPLQKAGMASSMINLVQQVGGSLGIAILATVLSHRIRFHLNVIGSLADSGSPAFQQTVAGIRSFGTALGYSHADATKAAYMYTASEIGKQASVLAFRDAFLVGAGTVAIALVAAFFLPNKVEKHASAGIHISE